MHDAPFTRLDAPGDLRVLTVRIEVGRGRAAITLRAEGAVRLALPERHAADVVAALARRAEEGRATGRSPGAGLYGDLFSGPLCAPVAAAIAWAAAAEGRRLHLVIESCDGQVGEWPLELLTHGEQGVIGAQPWGRVLREPFGGWPGAADDPEPRVARRIARWRRALERRLAERADEARAAGHWREALAFLRGLLSLRRQGHRPAAVARTLAELAPVLDWTAGEAAALAAAEEAAAMAGRLRAPLTRRLAWRFTADVLARRGDAAAAERLLERCVDLAARLGDAATEADDRVALVRLLFDQHRDREAVRLAPAARRACRHAGRGDLEGQLDRALAAGALRHDHERAARHLFASAAARLGRSGRPEAAAGAATNLGFLLLRRHRDDLAAAVFVAAVRTALQAADEGRDAAGVVVEGLLAPLVRDVAPHLLRRRRPDAVLATGLLLLWLTGPRLHAHDPDPVPDALRLLVGWCGRYLRLVGWVAAEGAVVEDGVSRVVAERIARRARQVAVALERLTGGVVPALRLHEDAVAAAHRAVRHTGPDR